jgi:uncharacterized protein YkwD
VRLLMVMALACVAPVLALALVGSPTEDGENVTAAGRQEPSALVDEAPPISATTPGSKATTTSTADPGDEASFDEAAASSTTTATTPVTEPPTTAAPTTTAAPPTPPTIAAAGTAAEEVVDLVNAARAAATPSCNPLTVDDRLAAAAQGHSDDMAANDYFSHTSLDGATAQDRAEAAGFIGLVGENIAAGQRSPQDVMAAWMDSDGHRANILNCDYTVIGVGLNEDGWYWTQMFGTAS